MKGLSNELQAAYVQLLLKGASPLGACQQLGVEIERLTATLAARPGFVKRVEQAMDVLSQNVLAALYQSAMKGNVTAIQFWLRHRPPPGWNASEPETSNHPDWETMDNAQLLEHARRQGLVFPPNLGDGTLETGRETASSGLAEVAANCTG